MVITKHPNRKIEVKVNGTDLERVTKTTYLGSNFD